MSNNVMLEYSGLYPPVKYTIDLGGAYRNNYTRIVLLSMALTKTQNAAGHLG